MTKIHVFVDVASCSLLECWEVDVPSRVLRQDDHAVNAFIYEALESGAAEFVDQTVSDEQNRTIRRWEEWHEPSI